MMNGKILLAAALAAPVWCIAGALNIDIQGSGTPPQTGGDGNLDTVSEQAVPATGTA